MSGLAEDFSKTFGGQGYCIAESQRRNWRLNCFLANIQEKKKKKMDPRFVRSKVDRHKGIVQALCTV